MSPMKASGARDRPPPTGAASTATTHTPPPPRYVSVTPPPGCLACGQPLPPGRSRRYCGPACKQAAYRRRNQPDTTPALPTHRSRREGTVYACGECEQRYLGEQWCHDCHRPCIRLGPGGSCPGCEDYLTVTELITGIPDPR